MNVDHPNAVFGRRGREIRAPAALADRAARPAQVRGHIVWLVGLTSLLLFVAGVIFWTLSSIEKANVEAARAEQRVVEIVNQPITHSTNPTTFKVLITETILCYDYRGHIKRCCSTSPLKSG